MENNAFEPYADRLRSLGVRGLQFSMEFNSEDAWSKVGVTDGDHRRQLAKLAVDLVRCPLHALLFGDLLAFELPVLAMRIEQSVLATANGLKVESPDSLANAVVNSVEQIIEAVSSLGKEFPPAAFQCGWIYF